MDIEFVNHSSFIAKHGGISLLCDPWIEGTSFNDGWALISPTRFRYEDFTRVTHIWFSHEHPDHYASTNLRKVPEQARSRIRILYQETRDRKVVDYCRKLGVADVQELPLGSWATLAPDFDVLCDAATHGDSWMAVRAGGKTLLNLNDCAIFGPSPRNLYAKWSARWMCWRRSSRFPPGRAIPRTSRGGGRGRGSCLSAASFMHGFSRRNACSRSTRAFTKSTRWPRADVRFAD